MAENSLRTLHALDPDVIALKQEDLEEFTARTNAITHLNQKRQEHLEEAQRCELLAHYVQEALTLWVEHLYGVDFTSEQWHLDLEQRLLIRQMPEPAP